MRFHRLHIPAFGPFTDMDLSFPKTGHDLHVFYGENEAGKSSLLRAIRDLLFGIHGQSTDNFLHEYKNLRVIGEIENRDGVRLNFQRRKGNKNTLLDEAGEALSDTALVPFLGSVDASYFGTMFGLGSAELREGAAQLLRGEGELGTALFSASLGGTPIQRVVDALTAESEQLFKGRSGASIRKAAAAHKELVKQSRECAIAADVWEQLEKEIERQQSERERLEREIAEHESESDWVGRCEAALPSIGKLTGEMKLLEELPDLPNVANDFVARAKAAWAGLGDFSRNVESLSAQIAQLESKLGACATSPQVMAVADELDSLHQDLGAYLAWKKTRTILQGKLAGIEPSLLTGMKSLGIQGAFESLDELRLGSAANLRIKTAAEAVSEASRQREETGTKLESLRSAIDAHQHELQSFSDADLEPLRQALAIASEATESYKTLEVSRSAVESLIRKAKAEQALVVGLPPELDIAAQLPIPSKPTIRKYADRFTKLEQEEKAAAKNAREEKGKIAKLQQELVQLERRGELPTEASLLAARERRDHGWDLVLKEWKGSGTAESLDAKLPLEEAFPKAIKAADEIADRLRIDAESVAEAEGKRSQILANQTAMDASKAEGDVVQISKRECQDAWIAEWTAAGISPRSPDEMEEWRDAWLQFRGTVANLREAEDVLRSKTLQIQTATAALAAALKESPDKSFAVLFDTARKHVQHGEESTGRRKQIAAQLEKFQAEKESLERKSASVAQTHEAAEASWKSESESAGLPVNTPPASGLALLRERTDLISKFDQWKDCSGELGRTTEALTAYDAKVSKMAGQLGIASDSTEAGVSALWKSLSSARAAQTEYEQLASQIKAANDDLALAKQKETHSRQSLDELMKLAAIRSVDELEPTLAGLEKRSEIRNRIDALRSMLGGLARGTPVEEFVARIEAENAEELPLRRTRIEAGRASRKDELRLIHDALSESKRKRDELARAGDAAADYRQQAESVAATMTQDASRFVRLRLAAYFLRVQIEQFRQQNQGPLLEKSGRIFSHITRNEFDGLAAEFNEQDVPVLKGRRANGTTVPVDGMSEGTRDQLYLALRIAALDRHLENHEPMPLILDDLLITFDNARSAAILPQLADLSQRTQIFLFTHHEHLVELCRQNLGEANFHLHTLRKNKAV